MSEVKWIKLYTDIFNNRKIKQIENMPDSDAILVIWLKLLILAGEVNESGYIMLTKEIPYTDEMLANEFSRNINTVRLALSVFEKFGMIEIVENCFCIANWEKYQNVEGLERVREQAKKRAKEYREKQKKIPERNVPVTLRNVTSNAINNVAVTHRNGIDIDKDKDKDKDKREEAEEDLKTSPAAEKSFSEIMLFFENNGFGLMTPHTLQEMEMYLADGIESKLIVRTLEEAIDAGKIGWGYAKAILKSCISEKVYTLQQFEARKKQRDTAKQNKAIASSVPQHTNFEQRKHDDTYYDDFFEKL